MKSKDSITLQFPGLQQLGSKNYPMQRTQPTRATERVKWEIYNAAVAETTLSWVYCPFLKSVMENKRPVHWFGSVLCFGWQEG